jgi:hypothetical protein
MATLIPALGAYVSRMTSGERRLGERLEQKLDADYLLWYDVPVGPKYSHPDFVVMHPRRGILVLEVKDWKLSTIQQADKQTWTIIPDGIPKTVANPLEQARQYAHQVVNALERDAQLVQADGPHQGKLAFPCVAKNTPHVQNSQRAAACGVNAPQTKVLDRLLEAGHSTLGGGFLGGMSSDKYYSSSSCTASAFKQDLALPDPIGHLKGAPRTGAALPWNPPRSNSARARGLARGRGAASTALCHRWRRCRSRRQADRSDQSAS